MIRLVSLLSLLLALAAPAAWAQSDTPAAEDDGGGFLERLIEDKLSSAGRQVRITGFEGALSSRATLDELVISDDKGPWLTLKGAVLDWNRTALLRGRLEVTELSAEELLLPRLPEPSGPQLPSPEAQPFSLPDLPVSISIGTLAIKRAELGQALFGEAAAVSLDGSARLAGGEGEAKLDVNRVDGEEGRLSLDASYANDNRVLSLDLSLEEGKDGIVANMIDLPGHPALALSLEGDGPLSDFAAKIALSTEGQERLSGSLSLASSGEGDQAVNAFTADLGGDLAPVFSPQFRPFFGDDIRLKAQGRSYADGRLEIPDLQLRAQAVDLKGAVVIGADRLPEKIDLAGRIGTGEGPVLLPFGQDIRIGDARLEVGFDAAQGEDWRARVQLSGLDTGSADVGEMTLTGQGRIASGDGGASVTADLDFTADGVALADGGAQQALGQQVTGAARIAWSQGQPVVLDRLAVNGETYKLDGSGKIDPTGDGTVASLDADFQAQNLSAFSALAGRPLGGAADLKLSLDYGLLVGSFDVALDGTTRGLQLGQEQLDNLLQGQADLTLRAERDESGTRVPELRLASPNVTLTGSADLTSDRAFAKAHLDVPDTSQVDPRYSGPASADLDAMLKEGTWQFDFGADGLQARLAANGTVSELDQPAPLVTAKASVEAADLSLFSPFAGRALGGAVDLQAEGNARADVSGFDLVLSGTTRDLKVDVEQADAVMAGTTRIDASAARDGGGITVRRLTVENPQLSLDGAGRYATSVEGRSQGHATASLSDLGLVLDGVTGQVEADLAAQQTDAGWHLDAQAQGLTATLNAALDITGIADTPTVAGRAALTATDLSRFAAVAKRPLAGGVDLVVNGSAKADATEFDLALKGTTSSLEVGIEQADPLLRGTTRLDIAASHSGARYEVTRLDVQNAQVSATGNGVYDPGQSRLTADIGVGDIGLAVPGMRGAVSARGSAEEIDGGWHLDVSAEGLDAMLDADVQVTGIEDTPKVAGRADLRAGDLSRFAALAKRPLGGTVNLSAEGFAVADASSFDLNVNGTSRDVAVGIEAVDRLMRGGTEIAVDAARTGDTVEVPRFSIVNPQITARGGGTYSPGAGQVSASVDVADTSQILPELGGPARLDLDAKEAGGGWDVDLTGRGLDADVTAKARVTEIESGAPVIDGSAHVTASDLSNFRALAKRPLAGSVDLTAKGRIKTDLSRYDMTVEGLGRGLRIGQADVDRILGARTDLALSVSRDGDGTPIRIRRAELNTPTLTASANGSYGAGQSDLTFDARLADVAPYAPGFAGPVGARGEIREAGSDLRLDVTGEGPGGARVKVTGTTRPDFSSVDLDVTGQAPLALANRLIAPRSVTGTLGFDVAVRGKPGLQAVSGRLSTGDGRAVLPSLGVVLNDINATVSLANGSANVQATLAKQQGGSITVSGPVALTAPYRADLNARLNEIAVRDPQLYETTVSGGITLSGPLAGGAAIGGTLRLGATEVRIPSTGLGATGPVPDIVHLNEPAASRATRARAGLLDSGKDTGGSGGGGGGAAYPLDLTILAENRIFVRGRGLDAELGGSLTLTGTTDNVIPAGQFDLIRGRLDILGKRLALDEGQIALQGDFSPYVRLVASTDAGDVTVQIVVEGPALAPDISFLSQPELPQDEVLARLLFNKSVTDISPLQAAQLASAVATLAGKGGDGIVGKLRQNFGLDDLDVTTDGNGNAALRAGKYLSDNIYSDVTVNAQGEAEVNLNLDVSKSVTVKGGATNTGETSLGVFFERDY